MASPHRGPRIDRRSVMIALGGVGVESMVWRRAVAQEVAAQNQVTNEAIQQAEWIAGLELTEEERDAIRDKLESQLKQLASLREVPVAHGVAPAIRFSVAPLPSPQLEPPRRRAMPGETYAAPRPDSDDDLAYLTVAELSAMLRARHVSSLELTQLYLERLKRFDPKLKCVVTLTEELALEQAQRADRELAAGRDRGPLHGIPWGAKDLISYPGYPTTWGATHLKNQVLNEKATVAERLDQAGAVLVAKLSLGALAMGDRWFGQMTRNPWNTEEGSSGSSAGSASATAAGLVGFALGSETLGSIISPSRRCGTTGLRPTFGRVSRNGCMTLTWSMDKIGPITRSVEDAALVLDAIHGADGRDATAVNQPFYWPSQRPLRSLRVGYVEGDDSLQEAIDCLRALGVTPRPINLPDQFPTRAVTTLLDVEAATVFDDITRNKITQDLNSWPDIFRAAEFVPAIDYLRANRVRTLMMEALEAEVFQQVDVYLGGDDLAMTNLTGHPSCVIPWKMRERQGVQVPSSLKLTAGLFQEEALLTVAHTLQSNTDYDRARPSV